MVPDRQKVWTDSRMDRMDGRTDDAKTISLRLHREIMRDNHANEMQMRDNHANEMKMRDNHANGMKMR